MTCRANIASTPMSLATAVRIDASSVRSIAGRGAQRRGRVAQVGDGVHRVGRRAAVAEREQLAAAPRSTRAARAAAAVERLAPVGERLRAQRARLARPWPAPTARRRRARRRGRSRPRRGTDRGTTEAPLSWRGAVVAAGEQPAVLEEHVHELPQHVVGRLDQLLRDERVVGRRHELPLRADRREGDGEAARRRAARTPSATSGRTEAIAMSSGPREQRRRPRTATPSAGSARLPTITGMDELDGDVAHVAEVGGRGAERDSRPPRAKRSAIAWHSRASRSASAAKNRSPQATRSSIARGRARISAGAARAARAAARATSRSALDALAGPRAHAHPLDARVHGVEEPVEALHREVDVLEQVDLVDDDQLAGAEHERVLAGLVVALGDRGDHDPRVLADVELGGADEVADVLDDQQVDLVERDRRQRGAHHVRVEVALAAEAAAGVELRDRDVQVGEPVGVERALHVALEHADAQVADAVAQQALEQRRLARARRAHDVEDRHAVAVEVVAVGPRDRVVGVERVLDDPHPHAMHAGLLRRHLDRLHLELLAAEHLDVRRPARRAAEHAAARSPTPRSHASQRSRAGHDLVLEPRALAHRLARRRSRTRTRSESGTTWRSRPTRTRHDRHAPPVRVPDRGVDDGGGDRELVHQAW